MQGQRLLCPDCPSELGRLGSGIPAAFFFGGTDHIFCNILIVSAAISPLESFFHQPVLPRVEGQNGCFASGHQDTGQLIKESKERLQLTVDINTQRLKDSLAGFLHRFFSLPGRKESQSFLDL